MTHATIEPPQPSGNAPLWRTYAGKRVVVHAPDGSYAATIASAELRAAEQIVAALEELLAPPRERLGPHLDIYLTDPIVAAPGSIPDKTDGDAIVRVVEPEAPGEPIARTLTRALAARWFGPGAAAASLLLDGISGLAAARSGGRPTIDEAQEEVRAALEAGRSVSIFERLDETRRETASPVATSFVAFLEEFYGAESLGHFLAAYDPDRSDLAAVTVYHQPLGALEDAWLTRVRHRPRRGTAFRSLFRQLLPLLKPFWVRELEATIYMLLGVALTLAVPLTIMHLIDHVLPHAAGRYRDLVLFVGVLLLVFVLDSLIGIRRTYLHHWINEQIVMALHHRLFTYLQRLSHDFYSRTKTGDIMASLSADLREIQAAMAIVAGNGLYQAVLAIATAITVLFLDQLLGLLVLVVVPFFAFGYVALRARWQRVAHEVQTLESEAENVALENFSAHGVVKAFGLEEHGIETYHRRHLAMVRSHLRLVTLSALFESNLRLASGIGHVLVFGVGGYQYINGDVTLGTLFAFAHLLPLFYEPIEKLADVGHTVEGASGAFDRIRDLLDEPIAIQDKPNAVALPPPEREIRLEGVTFGYDSDRPILHDLNLTIPVGADVAIVGPSGCGKSTVINLIMRFWDPQQGRVVYDDHDVRDVTLASLRSQTGLVFQDTFIFNTSVRENIAIGRPGATDAEIEAAAHAAQLDTFIDALPAGYHTVLGERGVRMSGGQRQRLAIARALLRDPRLLILDEATSALDPQTETEIQETLAVVARGRTTISITHRMAAVVTAERIFVLDQGRLVEEGHHAELVKAGGLYQRLYEEQMHYLHGGGVLRIGVEPERLRSIPLFAALTGEALDAVADRFMLERYAAGEDVVRQGDPGDKLYTISRGQLDVVIADLDGDGERRVNTLNEGDYFGEMALLTGAPRNATVRTTMPTQLYSLAKTDLDGLLTRVPGVRQAVSQTVAWRAAANAQAVAAATADDGGE